MYNMFHMMEGYYPNYMMGGFGTGGVYGIAGFVMMLLFWALIIIGIVLLVRFFIRQSRSGLSGKNALEILKERYAKGEINKEEFEKIKKDIRE